MHRDLQRAIGGGGDIGGELPDVDGVKRAVAIGRCHIPCFSGGSRGGKPEAKGKGIFEHFVFSRW